MKVILITVLAILVTIIASLDFRPDHNKEALRQLGATGKKSKTIAKFLDFYPGLKLFANLISLLSTIWIACLSATAWGFWGGCLIALIVIALAELLGARLISVTDQLVIANVGFLVKYFSWTSIFNSLTVYRQADPVVDVPELLDVLHSSRIDCPTQLIIEKALTLKNLPIGQLAAKWETVQKISFEDQLTPRRLDELFTSQQKIFPVIRNDDNDVVGLLHFMDISTINQTPKQLLSSMHRNFATCDYNTPVPTALKLMSDYETTVIVIMRNKKVYGLVNLADVLANEPICSPS